MPKPFIITIVGPESSGKTTLARQLAGQYGCSLVSEFAREYLTGLERPYHEGDLALMAERQLEILSNAISGLSAVLQENSSGLAANPLAFLPPNPLKGASITNSERYVREDVFVFPANPLIGEKNTNANLTFQRELFGYEPRPLLVVDSGMMSLRMWARIKYGTTIPVVEEALKDDVTSMYVLCRPVLPWVSDPLREAPSLLERVWIYNQYLKELVVA